MNTKSRLVERRLFLGGLAAGIIAVPLAAYAQEAQKVWRIGFLEAGAPAANQHFLKAFRGGLRELGYVEGQNVVIVDRWADGNVARFPSLLTDLVQQRVDIIVVSSTAGAVAAKTTVTSVPVIFVGVQDPVGIGLVPSLGRPGGLFREAVPPLEHLALIWNPTAPGVSLRLKEARNAGARFNVTIRPFEVRDAKELEGIFAAMSTEHLTRLMVLADPLTVRNRTHIVELANKSRLPAIYPFLEFAHAGGLMAYGPSVSELFRRAPIYVDKIFKGAKPAELPVEQPTKFDLVINLRTAKALGLTIPRPVLARADELIQ